MKIEVVRLSGNRLLYWLRVLNDYRCDFTGIMGSAYKARRDNPYAMTFEHQGQVLAMTGVWSALLLLPECTKVVHGQETLKPFYDVVMTHDIQHVRQTFTYGQQRHHIEVSTDGGTWRYATKQAESAKEMA